MTPARTMGRNDLWVAATAHLAQATLISTDMDFKHSGGVRFDFEFVAPR